MFASCQEHLVYPHGCPAAAAWFSAYWDGPLWSLQEVVLENQPTLLDLCSLKGYKPCYSLKHIPKEATIYSPEVQSSVPSFWKRVHPPSRGHCSQSCSWPLHPLVFVGIRSSTAFTCVGSSVFCVRKLPSVCFRNLSWIAWALLIHLGIFSLFSHLMYLQLLFLCASYSVILHN